MGDNDNKQLESEFRQMLMSELRELKAGQEKINEKLSTFATQAMLSKVESEFELEINKMSDRIVKIEKFQYQLLGIGIAINVGLIIYTTFFKK